MKPEHKMQINNLSEFIADPDENGCRQWLGGSFIGERPAVSIPKSSNKSLVSREVLKQSLGRDLKEGMCACHTCDNPWCVAKEHLWEGTNKENSQDMIEKLRGSQGEKNPLSKLTNQKVIEIRISKDTASELAERYGVSQGLVYKIKNKQVWKHI